jgi:hypothetical protein
VRHPSHLDNGGTHLRIERPSSKDLRRIGEREVRVAARAAPRSADDALGTLPGAEAPPPGLETATGTGDPETAIYVHPVTVSSGGRLLLYLDYWWYLPDNPVTIGGSAFCGPGLVIPGVTCHNHESDWEGMTVVVDRAATPPEVVSVQYAQHEDVVAFSWKRLRALWDRDYPGIVADVENGAQRPLAFIAAGTHSTYTDRCVGGCKQFVHPDRGEADRDGMRHWVGNFTNTCGTESCVHRLPTRDRGQQPALWNAFTGPWGERNCVLRYYCDSGKAPTAPGTQERFDTPARCDGSGDSGRFSRGPCAG